MAYTALYRKFRPSTFSEMVGQEHITRTLKNQILANRVGHAYLFNGGRGTGKTSAAKVLARAINCVDLGEDGEPCNKCEICLGALDGSLLDIEEMDAASNNSVEDIRQIRDAVNFLPTQSKYRVYIIDEVHMLSTGAFNALLKTLEEPPAHVKFILATTEPQKLPATILSRCQRFDFKKISNDNIQKRLEFVCKESNISIDVEALKLIAILSEGAMRDALSILERCIQDGSVNEKIDVDKIKDLVGIPKFELVYNIVKPIVEYSIDDAIIAVDEILNLGKDINNCLWEIIKYVKDILIFKSGGKLSLYSQKELEDIKFLSDKIEKQRLIYIVYELSSLENRLRTSMQKDILFQVEIIKLCNKIVEAPKIVQSVDSVVQNQEKTAQAQNAPKKPKVNIPGIERWSEIVADFRTSGKIALFTNLVNSKAIKIDDNTIGLSFPNGLTAFGKAMIEKTENLEEIKRVLSESYGKQIAVRIVEDESTLVVKKSEDTENLVKKLDIPVNIIE